MTERSWLQRLRDAGSRHEHALIAAWLVGALLLFAVLGVWGVLLGGAEDAVRSLDRRWIARLERGEELVRLERWDLAESYLERLDREFPARISTHKYDQERERLLTALGATYLALDRKGRCLDTLRALVAFDPRNWRNHATLAEACEALGEDGEAALAWDRVLAIQPANPAAARARILAEAEAGRYAAVPPLYRAYLDAFLVAALPLELAGAATGLELPVDGRFHEVDVPLAAVADGSAPLVLDTAGFSVELDWVELVPARAVGQVRPAEPVRWHAPLPDATAHRGGSASAPAAADEQPADAAVLPPDPTGAPAIGADPDGAGTEAADAAAAEPGEADAGPATAGERRTTGLDPLGGGRHAARWASTRIAAALPFDGRVARVRARVRLFKPLDAELWQAVEKSYRNALDFEGLRDARDRSVVGGDPAAVAALAD